MTLFIILKHYIPIEVFAITKKGKVIKQNIKNVELISASSLNTLSLMKAKQIILTPLAVNDIKEIFCD